MFTVDVDGGDELMIKPALQNAAFLADVAAAKSDTAHLHLWWLGQSGYLVRWPGGFLLIDPYLSDSLTQKYADTDKPHVRMTELVVDPARLDYIDVVTSSHNHTDHLDAATLLPLMRVNPKLHIVVPEANRNFVAARLETEPASLIGMGDGVKRHVAGLTIHGLPAAHDQLEQDERGHHRFMGYIFELPMADGRTFTIYHSGDTLFYEGMIDRLRRFEIDLALLPINGRGPERKVAGNLWGQEAANLAHAIAAKIVVPCHYDMFTFNTAAPDEFVTSCQKLNRDHRILRCGERLSL